LYNRLFDKKAFVLNSAVLPEKLFLWSAGTCAR